MHSPLPATRTSHPDKESSTCSSTDDHTLHRERQHSSQRDGSPAACQSASDRYHQQPLLWTDGRRTCSEPAVDSGRSSLTSYTGSEDSLLLEDDVFSVSDCYNLSEEEEEDESCSPSDGAWKEWTIPASDIQLHEVIAASNKCVVRSGYWHGQVWMYSCARQSKKDVDVFVSEVNTLCRIRHENIQLFMGVCLDLPADSMGIVMSKLKGETLYSHIHRLGHNFTTPSKLKILRQIAEGMEYLHAKGICHGCLTSSMVTIHHRVCISLNLSSFENSRKLTDQELVYIPPEDVKVIRVVDRGQLYLQSRPTVHGDIFAFGTITYELVTMNKPFKSTPLVSQIWQVGNGKCQPLTLLPRSRFRSIIHRCWRDFQAKRPSFVDILASVEDMPLLHKPASQLSLSVPGELCTLGRLHSRQVEN